MARTASVPEEALLVEEALEQVGPMTARDDQALVAASSGTPARPYRRAALATAAALAAALLLGAAFVGRRWLLLRATPSEAVEEVSALESLFCITLARPPPSEHKDLLKMHYLQGVGIFACDEFAIYSTEKMEIVPGVHSIVIPDGHDTQSDAETVEAPSSSRLALHMWRLVRQSQRFQRYAWTVKVEVESVFFPKRLRPLLVGRAVDNKAVYLNNCKFGLRSPLEVLSRSAVDALAGGSLRCERELWFPLIYQGEDYFTAQCLRLIGVQKQDEWRALCEERCECPEFGSCQKSEAAAFYPHWTPEDQLACLMGDRLKKLL